MATERVVGGGSLRAALDLFETGVEVMRQNLRRANPQASPAEIDAELRRWLQTRPGAEFGDCPGRRVDITSGR